MTLISLCLICKNEEKVLERCLKSVKGIVDEMIIVDTGSTDGTVKIAEKYGAIVLHHEWKDDFAKARNVGLKKASGRWILFLDADEELHSEDALKLRQLAEEGQEIMYFFQVLNLLKNGIDSCPVLRFFQNHPNIEFEGRVHEQIIFSIRKQFGDVPFQYTDIRILHYGYLEQIVAEKNKKERNFRLIMQQVKEEPNNAFHRYNFAGEYLRLGRYEEALEQLRNTKKLCKIEEMAFGHLAVKKEVYCLAMLGKIEEALEVSKEETKRFPDYPDLFFSWGNCAFMLQKNDEAKKALEKVIQIESVPFHYAVDLGIQAYRAPFLLGQIYEAEKTIDKALKYYRQAWLNKPDYTPAFYRYIVNVQEHDVEDLLKEVKDIKNPQIGIPILLLLFGVDYYKASLYVIRQIKGIKTDYIKLLEDLLRNLSEKDDGRKRVPIIAAVDAWLKDDKTRLSMMKNKKPLFEKIFMFLTEAAWEDGIKPSKEDWLLLIFSFKKANGLPDHKKMLQLFQLWRYLANIDPEGKRFLGLSLCERSRKLLNGNTIYDNAKAKIPHLILEMDLMNNETS